MSIIGAAVAAGLAIYNGIRQNKQNRDNRHHDRTMMRENAQLNLENAKATTDHNAKKQLELWDKTNYSAQMEQMRKAGLNPGLMYGMGGGGGQIMNVSSGNASTGHSSSQGKISDINDIMVLQNLKLGKAQEELTKAQTEKTEAEAEKIEGVDTEESKVRAQEGLTRISQIVQDVLEKQMSQDDRMSVINSEAQKAIEEIQLKKNERQISDATVQDEIKKVKEEAIGAALTNELLKEDAKLTKEQQKEIKARINKMAEDIAQGWQRLSIEEKRAKIQKFAEEMKASYPSIFNSTGRVVDQGIRVLEGIFKWATGNDKAVGDREIKIE